MCKSRPYEMRFKSLGNKRITDIKVENSREWHGHVIRYEIYFLRQQSISSWVLLPTLKYRGDPSTAYSEYPAPDLKLFCN